MSLLLLLRTRELEAGAVIGSGAIAMAGPAIAGVGVVRVQSSAARRHPTSRPPAITGAGGITMAGPLIRGRGTVNRFAQAQREDLAWLGIDDDADVAALAGMFDR